MSFFARFRKVFSIKNYEYLNNYYNLTNKVHLSHYSLKFLSQDTSSYITDIRSPEITKAILNLDFNYNRRQRIYKNQVESILKYVEEQGNDNDALCKLLIDTCGNLMLDELPKTRLLVAKRIWNLLEERKVKLNVDHYNTLLKCYIENGLQISHNEFLKNMKCSPNEQTYYLLLECVCENGKLDEAVDIVRLMKENKIPANEFTFSSLILAHLKCGDKKSADNVLATMKIAHINIGTTTYTSLLRGYAEMGDIESFQNALNESSIFEFSSKEVASVLNTISMSKNIEQLLLLVKKHWSFMIESRKYQSEIIKLCISLIHNEKPLFAYEIFCNFIEPESGFVSRSDVYGGILFYEMAKAETPSHIIIKIADELIKSNKNSFALIKALEVGLKLPNVKLSLDLLKALKNKNMKLKNHYFWPLLAHEGKNTGEKGVLEILKVMTELEVPIERETLETYSLQFIDKKDPDLVINKLKEFNLSVREILNPLSVLLLQENNIEKVTELGVKYKVKLDTNSIMKSLAVATLATKDLENALNLLKFFSGKDGTEDWAGLLLLNILTRSVNKNQKKTLINLMKVYEANEIKISHQVAEKMEYHISRIEDKQIMKEIRNTLSSLEYRNNIHKNNNIPHPRDMNVEELECHLIELRNKNMDTRGIIRKLIQAHCRIGNIERVSELCEEFQQSNYTMSVGMKASLIDLYVKKGKLKEALNIYNDIKSNSPSFLIDEFKIIDLATLFITKDKIEDAIKLLEEESHRRKIRGTEQIERNCYKLLTTIAETGDVEGTQNIFKTLVKCGYCTDTNFTLSPLIMVHITNGDLTAAVNEYIKICETFKKTPYVYDLLSHLLEEDNTENLVQKVLDATRKIQNPNIAQMLLAIALAKAGKVGLLRKLLSETKTMLPSSFLEPYCQHWLRFENNEVLENLITSTKDITRIDKSLMYLTLMKIYSSKNDCNSALQLWDDAQEISHPDAIKHVLINLLKREKHQMAKKIT